METGIPIETRSTANRMGVILIEKIGLPIRGFSQLTSEAAHEGYGFLDTLANEWQTGANRFDAPGEILCGHLHEGILIAIGGLNRDPFLNDPTVGRIRRLYVRQGWRNRGIGGALLDSLLQAARRSFAMVRLRSGNLDAARLYERKGFAPISNPTATHLLYF